MESKIVSAAQQKSIVAATIAYSALGYSVLPLHGKRPAVKSWEQFQHRPPDAIEIGRWHAARLLHGVGIICGAASHNLVVMDLDSISAIAAFELVFPALRNTFAVLTGSGQGKHYYYQVDDLPPTTRVLNVAGGNLELRANGCYVVAPPSRHPDTDRLYQVINAAPVMRLPDMNAVKQWLYGFIATKKTPAPTPTPAATTQNRTMGFGWAGRALQYEARDVRLASEGERNNRLNIAAYNIGQIVGDGHLSYNEAGRELLAAAIAAGLPEDESRRTIISGLQAGMAEPRSQQWRKRNTTN